jgi:hypothetical protein
MTFKVLLDPTSEKATIERARLPRPQSLKGITVALLDITKPRGDIFLSRIGELLEQQGVLVKHFRKPTFTKPAPVDVRLEITNQCQAVIEALAD